MKIPILTVRDENGNEIPIPAIKGKDGITPHIGKNGNWFIGDKDTGISAGGGGSGGNSGMTLLWENAVMSTYEEFPTQEIAIASGYTKYLVQVVSGDEISYLFMQRRDAQVGYYDDYIDGDYVWLERYGSFAASVENWALSQTDTRTFRLYPGDDTKIFVSDGYSRNTSAQTRNNAACIPWRIYGIS